MSESATIVATYDPEKGTYTTDVIKCARCGSLHQQIVFAKLQQPIEAHEYIFTHWALCPRNNEPILLQILDDETDAEIDTKVNKALNALINNKEDE